MFIYAKLWILLKNKGMKKSDLRKYMSPNTVAKLSKNENVDMKVIDKLCEVLECQPGDIMEFVSDTQVEMMKSKVEQMEDMLAKAIQMTGMTKEEFMKSYEDQITNFVNKLENHDAFTE